MVKYTLFLKIPGPSPVGGYEYSLDLSQAQEDNPQNLFTPNLRQDLKTKLQNASSCAVRDNHLHHIINTWIEDIREGYRETTIHLNLPLLEDINLETIQDQGNQELPPFFPPDLTGIEPRLGMLPPLEDILSP